MQIKQLATPAPVSGETPRIRWIRLFGVLVILLVAIAGTLYLNSAWQRYNANEIQSRFTIGSTIASLIRSDCVKTLDMLRLPNIPVADSTLAQPPSVSGDTGSVLHDPSQRIRGGLIQVAQENDSISALSLVAMQDDRVYTLLSTADDPQPTLTDAERQGIVQAYQTRRAVSVNLLDSGKPLWLNVFTPIRENSDGEVIGVLSITYKENIWMKTMIEHMLPDLVVTVCLLILCAALFRVGYSQATLRVLGVRMAADEALFHGVFEQAPIGISIGRNDKVTYAAPDGRFSVNRRYSEILGRNPDELGKLDWRDITHPDDLAADLALQEQYQHGIIPGYSLEKRFRKPDGEYVWTNLMISRLQGGDSADALHICLLEDISARKRAEEALAESERSKAVLLSHLPGLAYRCKFDRQWTMQFVSEGCEALTGYRPESLIQNRDISFNDLIAPEYRDLLWNEWIRVLNQHNHFRHEYELITRDGTRKWVMELGQFILDEHDEVLALEGIIIDITETKLREAQVSYLNEHDFMTGLFNRTYYAQQKQLLAQPEWMPVSVAICDINGVRLVNDAFGLSEGDHMIADVAHLLQQACRNNDVLCRTGGDEFALLMPHTPATEAARLTEEILRSVDRYNRYGHGRCFEVSISIGFSTAENGGFTLEQALIEAEGHLNHRKLVNQKSSHNAIVSSIMAALYARSQETEEHGQRLTQLTRMIGEAMELNQSMLDDLMLLSMLHDIGKVGVDDRILNKPGPLTPEEWQIMKTHSEIGHRIASSTPELEHIADWILAHHEQWNGGGYPRGLAGEDIPLPARILTVADAYDAMTQNRVYRAAMSESDALAEMERCAGTQFDPQIALLFVRLMRNRDQHPM